MTNAIVKKLIGAPPKMWRDAARAAKRKDQTLTEWVRDAIRISLQLAKIEGDS